MRRPLSHDTNEHDPPAVVVVICANYLLSLARLVATVKRVQRTRIKYIFNPTCVFVTADDANEKRIDSLRDIFALPSP